MAVDTEAKRRSTLATRLVRMGIRRVLPPAAGSVSVGSRATIAGAYAGFLYGVVVSTLRRDVIISFMKRVEDELGPSYAIDWPNLDFSSAGAGEWVRPRYGGFVTQPTRSSERFETWKFAVTCCARTGAEGGKAGNRTSKIAADVLTAFGQHDLAVRNWSAAGDPIVGWVRFGPGALVPVGRSVREADLDEAVVVLTGKWIG